MNFMRFFLSLFVAALLLVSCSVAGLPDAVEIVDEQDAVIPLEKSGSSFSSGNFKVSFSQTPQGLAASLSAPGTQVKYVRAVWNKPAREGSLYLGD